MKKERIEIDYLIADSINELEDADRQLFEEAVKALETAYAPYSEFNVGAAVALENGEIVRGSNQENIAYPSGLCAERVAIFAAASQYPGVPIHTLAIAARHRKDLELENNALSGHVTPCGACRQVIMEYERLLEHPIRILTGATAGRIYIIENAESLLPLVFYSESLIKGR